MTATKKKESREILKNPGNEEKIFIFDCGGTDRGKCEADKDRDCVWTLIYNALKEKKKFHLLKRDAHTQRPLKDVQAPQACPPLHIA